MGGHQLGEGTVEVWQRTVEDQLIIKSKQLGDVPYLASDDEVRRAIGGVTNVPNSPDHHLSMTLNPLGEDYWLNVRLTKSDYVELLSWYGHALPTYILRTADHWKRRLAMRALGRADRGLSEARRCTGLP